MKEVYFTVGSPYNVGLPWQSEKSFSPNNNAPLISHFLSFKAFKKLQILNLVMLDISFRPWTKVLSKKSRNGNKKSKIKQNAFGHSVHSRNFKFDKKIIVFVKLRRNFPRHRSKTHFSVEPSDLVVLLNSFSFSCSKVCRYRTTVHAGIES